jgi:hypothetical protein
MGEHQPIELVGALARDLDARREAPAVGDDEEAIPSEAVKLRETALAEGATR